MASNQLSAVSGGVKLSEKTVRYGLGSVLLFIALNAFGGGYYGMAGAEAIPIEWLEGSPFTSYFLPSLILFLGVGGTCLVAAVAVFRQYRFARTMSLITGVILLGWISVQLIIIGYVSWMQPAIVGSALLIFFLGWRLPDA